VRYAYLVESLGISSANILYVTFTNKTDQELRKRIRSMVTPGNSNDFIITYHGFCVKVLREEIYKLSYPKSFIVMDTEDQVTILIEIFGELDITSKNLSFKKAIRYIQLNKIISNGYCV
jgi:DNA helicase-2/ATP-dependent DNA helicase PcrA